MLRPTLFAAVLAASAAFAAALPAKNTPQDVVALSPPVEAISDIVYSTISPDGSCGGQTGYTCEGSAYGNCCSIYGFCGATESFCGANCFAKAGLCATKPIKAKANSVIEVEEEVVVEEPSPVAIQPAAVHTPWKPTPFHDPQYKPSYVIDNGERAPNQVWN